MCGRYTLRASPQKVRELFPLFEIPDLQPRFNIAPTQQVLTVLHPECAQPRAAMLRWGLIPSWAKEKKIGATLINARADTLASKPAFRAAFKCRRCLILADGFYEWQKVVPVSNQQADLFGDDPLETSPTGKKVAKQPFYIHLSDGRPFAFAGLWEKWTGEQPAVESCTIITTDANDAVKSLHDRMPVILDPRDYAPWLDPSIKDPGVLQEMLRPFPSDQMTTSAVGQRVNNARNEGADCLASN